MLQLLQRRAHELSDASTGPSPNPSGSLRVEGAPSQTQEHPSRRHYSTPHSPRPHGPETEIRSKDQGNLHVVNSVRQIGPSYMKPLALPELQPSQAFAGEVGNRGGVLE
eukprot:1960737-Pyramimonas_sp.AAC.1